MQANLFPDAAEPKRNKGAEKIIAVLEHYMHGGFSLSEIADGKHMGRSVNTLKKYARLGDLQFPDYTPRAKKENTK